MIEQPIRDLKAPFDAETTQSEKGAKWSISLVPTTAITKNDDAIQKEEIKEPHLFEPMPACEPETDVAHRPMTVQRIGQATGDATNSEFTKHFKKVSVISKKTGCYNKVFECSMCGKTISQLCNMQNHLRVHLRLKPFGCKLCGKAFATRSNCNHHVKMRSCQRGLNVSQTKLQSASTDEADQFIN